jgi:hypothetical protein
MEDDNSNGNKNLSISNAESNSDNYFQFYSKLLNQQNMLQDYVRTSTYFNAIQANM